MTRVLIASASEVSRSGLASLLAREREIDVVATAATPDAMSRGIVATVPDVIVVESDGDDERSVALVAAAVESGAGPAVVVMTDGPVDLRAVDGRRIGGSAVLPRRAGERELTAAIAAAAAGLIVTHAGADSPQAGAETSRTSRPAATLTPRELEVLRMLGSGLPNKAIALRLRVSAHTVKFHVGSIMAKLHSSSRTEAVTEGIRRGLIYL
jgi:NarL family two-component system response regulator YdfI